MEAEELEKTTTKTKRDEWLDRVRQKHPEHEFANDDDFYTSAMEDEDLNTKTAEERKAQEQSLVDLIAERPQLGALLGNLKDMKDPEAVAKLIGMYGEDFKNSLDNEEALKAMAEAQSARMEREAKNKSFAEQCDKDFESRLGMIGAFCESKGMGEDDAAKFIGTYLDFCYRGSTSKFEEADLEAFFKGSNYDNDIQEAETKGKIKGANEKIELKKKENASDVPVLSSERTDLNKKKPQVSPKVKDNWDVSGYKPGKRY